ncbi:methylmalonyl Co-A mutase-associated GTPase MeaB [Candidatus Poribacteria bacterium]|nr:methylmalonyl Co-A mutase-associated GTPase MeaB [Candidatus Poribacteria bacterium]
MPPDEQTPRGPRRRRYTPAEMAEGVARRDRAMLGRAITLVESSRADDRAAAREMLGQLMPRTGGSWRLGVSGVPGAGKSTFIEALGTWLTARGRRVAVLAVDPSSRVSRGSILGDKTRMVSLATYPTAFVRPSPCGGWLGGVARGTREALLVCEAAGYDVVLVETVGVGQSESEVASMTDCFVVLMLAGAGDDLQGMKRGILEHADVVAINKADGERIRAADAARAQLESALHLLRPPSQGWSPPVLVCSALERTGIAEIWGTVAAHREALDAAGGLKRKREEQALAWMEQSLEQLIRDRFYTAPGIKHRLAEARRGVMAGKLSPAAAAEMLLEPARDDARAGITPDRAT